MGRLVFVIIRPALWCAIVAPRLLWRAHRIHVFGLFGCELLPRVPLLSVPETPPGANEVDAQGLPMIGPIDGDPTPLPRTQARPCSLPISRASIGQANQIREQIISV